MREKLKEYTLSYLIPLQRYPQNGNSGKKEDETLTTSR